MIIGVAFLMIFIAAVTSFGVLWYVSRDAPEEEAEGIGPTYQLGDFTVNLAGATGYNYLQADLVVEVSDEEVIEELTEREPQVKDQIISILRNQDDEQIMEPGAAGTKEMIRDALNELVTEGEVRNVFFTHYVVQ